MADGLRPSHEPDPARSFALSSGRAIQAFLTETVPGGDTRFGLRLLDAGDQLVGGLSGRRYWDWLFVDALWVHGQVLDPCGGAYCENYRLYSFSDLMPDVLGHDRRVRLRRCEDEGYADVEQRHAVRRFHCAVMREWSSFPIASEGARWSTRL